MQFKMKNFILCSSADECLLLHNAQNIKLALAIKRGEGMKTLICRLGLEKDVDSANVQQYKIYTTFIEYKQ